MGSGRVEEVREEEENHNHSGRSPGKGREAREWRAKSRGSGRHRKARNGTPEGEMSRVGTTLRAREKLGNGEIGKVNR